MNTDSPVYNELNKAWKATCRIIFGEEIGELEEYEAWLSEYLPQIGRGKSHVSGKDVTLAMDDYCKTAKFVSADEMKEASIPLGINEIKDIDSVVGAISERWEYAGDRTLGRSSHVEASDFIVDSHYVRRCVDVTGSVYACMASNTQDSKYVFGCRGFFFGEFAIAFVKGTKMRRVVGSHLGFDSSDVYFSANCTACHDIMFSFNQTNKRNCIGNLELPKDRYAEIKKKLLKEIVGELRRNKRFPSIVELVPKMKADRELKVQPAPAKSRNDMSPIEKAFTSTSKVLLKKELAGISQYEPWLSRHVSVPKELKSPFGADVMFSALVAPLDPVILGKGLVSIEEAAELGRLRLEEKDVTSLERIKDGLSRIGYITTEILAGNNSNVIKSPILFNDINVYKVDRALTAENSAIGYLVSNSKYIFGSNKVSMSQFCMKCYYSTRLTRCFEVDTSTDCTDSYFCHNSEGLQEAMFCWNTKGKRYAIGNSPLPPEQYRKIKDMLVQQMADEIIRTKGLKYDIFNVGCGKP